MGDTSIHIINRFYKTCSHFLGGLNTFPWLISSFQISYNEYLPKATGAIIRIQ